MKRRNKEPVRAGVASVPVIMQMDAEESGAASLSSVLAYYGRWIPLAQARIDCGISRDGSKLKNIVTAAESYGMDAAMCKGDLAALKRDCYPCIVKWKEGRFAVLCGFRRERVYLCDPENGSVRLSEEDFLAQYEEEYIRLAPTDRFVPGGKQTSMISYAAKRMRGTYGEIAFIMLTAFAVALTVILLPIFKRVLTDRMLVGSYEEWTVPFLLLFLLVAAVQIAAMAIRENHLVKIRSKMSILSNSSFFWHVLHMPMEFFFQRTPGDLQNRQEVNAEIANTLVLVCVPILLNAAMVVFYLVVMLRYSVPLTVVGVISVLLNILFSRMVMKQRVNLSRRAVQSKGRLSEVTTSGIRMVGTIQLLGAEDGFYNRWSGYQNSLNNAQVGYTKLFNYFGFLPELVVQYANTLVVVLGIWLAMKGRFSVGMIMAFQGFLDSFLTPAEALVNSGESIQEMRAQMERVEDVMSYPEDALMASQRGRYSEDDPRKYEKLKGNVELRHVTFGYSRLEEPILKDFSLTLRARESVALVGLSGCGKSTIGKLITGLYQPWSGEILIDGIPIAEIDRDTFCASLAVVDQDITIFEDTIANNIKMWDDSIENYEMVLAARDAQIHSDIVSRPGGFNYVLTEGGRDLSGGQRQRLEIARALAQEPTLLIMDEATSALDAVTEDQVVRAIRERGITTIVIAHRLSTIRDCNEIIVMDRGRIAERGTHEELMAAGGLYRKLVNTE